MSYVGNQPIDRTVESFGDRFNYVATLGQTTISGNDIDGKALAYTVSNEKYIDVWVNGSLLKNGTDYEAITGNSITNITPDLEAGDEVAIRTYGEFLEPSFVKTDFSNVLNRIISGDKISGGVVEDFRSEGITDNAAETKVTVEDDGRLLVERVHSDNGTASNPVYSFKNSTGSGIYRQDTNVIGFSTAATHRASILSSGEFLFSGLTSTFALGSGNTQGSFFNTNGTLTISRDNTHGFAIRRTTSNGAVAQFWRENTEVGSISVDATETTYNTSSDYRLKINKKTVKNAISQINKLNPYTFNWKRAPDKETLGFFAHEVAEVIPGAVQGEKDAVDADGNPIYQTIDHSKLVPLLVAALQEEIKARKELEKRIKALEDGIGD